MDRYLPLWLGLAFLWGLSEASFFFVVPDVIISVIALKYGFRQGLYASAAGVVGAALGGLLVYFWGRVDITAARAAFDMLPAIAPSTIARATKEISEPAYGLAMLKGSFSGIPFKLYASEAGAFGTSLLTLIALTPLVRLPRFLIAATSAALLRRFAPSFVQMHKFKLLAAFWLIFYALYWTFAPN